jgi:hypothetical protein
MRIQGIVVLTVALLAWTVCAVAEEVVSPEQVYEEEVSRLRAGDTTVDFTALRMAFAETEGFHPLAMRERDLRSEAVQAVNAGDCEAALDAIDRLFEINYLYPDAHLGASICHERLGNGAEASFHREVVHGLFWSICPVDSGLEMDQPCTVIATYEEYFVLSSMGLPVKEQELLTCNGNPCDRTTALDPETGDEVQMYFDVSIPFREMGD